MNKNDVIVLGKGFLGKTFEEKGYKVLDKSQFVFPSNLKSKLTDYDIHSVLKLDNHNPKVVINTIAYTNTKEAQTNAEKCMQLNAWLPKCLSEFCNNRNIKFVHISTGCVYSSPHSYKKYEEDSPLSVYVASKQLGDSLCNLERDLIIRPRLVFGHFEHKNNILSKLLKFDSFIDEQNSMTSVETIVEAIESLLENNKSGIYNVAQEGTISMYEIAEYFDKFIKREVYNKFKKNKILMSPNLELDISKLKEVYSPRNINDEIISCYRRLTGKEPKVYNTLPLSLPFSIPGELPKTSKSKSNKSSESVVEEWNKCEWCGNTIKTWNSHLHDRKICLGKKYYAGIGSRSTPKDVCDKFSKYACLLNSLNYILRSGGADGADLAFEKGAGDNKEIYIPWKNFNNSNSNLFKINPKAFELASEIHPAWNKCSPAVRKLHARNIMQVSGYDLNNFVDFVLCWTENGITKGGTATAINYAKSKNIPIFNFGLKNDESEFKKYFFKE